MSTIITFDLKELRTLATDKETCVIEKKLTQNLALEPRCLGNVKESVRNLLNYKIGKFDREFEGILMSYKKLGICNTGSIRTDSANVQFQVQANYFIFQPCVGAMLRGIVIRKSHAHLGILVNRVFNAVIPRPTDLPGDKWIGSSVQEGQTVVFKIVVLDIFGALPYIRGELDEKFLEDNVEGPSIYSTDLANALNVSYIKFDKIKPSFKAHIFDFVSTTEEVLNKSKRKSNNQGTSATSSKKFNRSKQK